MWLALEACIEEEEEEKKKRECGSAEMAMCVARHAAWLLAGARKALAQSRIESIAEGGTEGVARGGKQAVGGTRATRPNQVCMAWHCAASFFRRRLLGGATRGRRVQAGRGRRQHRTS